jgi:ABC-type polysaccharide/polyol phosphate export permease
MAGVYITNRTQLLSQRLELIYSIVIRNLKIKYQRSIFGFIWTLFNPLITVLVLSTVFSYVIRIEMEDYWAFLLSGYFAWNFSQLIMNSGTYLLSENAELIRSIKFPMEVIILGAGLAKTIEFSVELLIILLIIAFFRHESIPISYSIVPVIIVINFFIVTGIQFIVATSTAFYRDIHHALPLALITLFYISPIFYPLSMVPDSFKNFYLLNPFTHILTCYQSAIYQGVFPSSFFLLTSIGIALLLSISGWLLFNSHKNVYSEII